LEQLKFPAALCTAPFYGSDSDGSFATAECWSEASSVQLKLKYPQLANIVFLGHVGQTLREATSDIPQEELPKDIQRLLRRLERVEIRDARRKAGE
jgi:hypothetical protein